MTKVLVDWNRLVYACSYDCGKRDECLQEKCPLIVRGDEGEQKLPTFDAVPGLQDEINAWDHTSGEALNNFEKDIPEEGSND